MAIYLRTSMENASSIVVDTPTAGVTKGDFVTTSSVYGFAFTTANLDTTDTDAYATKYTLITKAREAEVSKASGTGSASFSQGDAVYYDSGAGNATDASTGNILIGYAKADAGELATEVLIEFDGTIVNF